MTIVAVVFLCIAGAYVVFRLGYNTGYGDAVSGAPHYFHPEYYSDDGEDAE